MKTVQLDPRLCMTYDIRVLQTMGTYRTYAQLLHPGRPEELVPLVDVSARRQTNAFLQNLPEPGSDKGRDASYQKT